MAVVYFIILFFNKIYIFLIFLLHLEGVRSDRRDSRTAIRLSNVCQHDEKRGGRSVRGARRERRSAADSRCRHSTTGWPAGHRALSLPSEARLMHYSISCTCTAEVSRPCRYAVVPSACSFAFFIPNPSPSSSSLTRAARGTLAGRGREDGRRVRCAQTPMVFLLRRLHVQATSSVYRPALASANHPASGNGTSFLSSPISVTTRPVSLGTESRRGLCL